MAILKLDFDKAFYPEGLPRCNIVKFSPVLLIGGALLTYGLVGAALCLGLGLNQTGMNDYFAFGLWIVFDLAVIALGAGAFFTGFMTYFLGQKQLKDIINAAVIIGFICYAGAVGMLGVDIGQPIRGWFIFWHANVHSMLTEVSFCISTYLVVLIIEYLPTILENRKAQKFRENRNLTHNFHEFMFIFAGVGTFLSFFHQGSLGGMFGVLFARPFAFREGILIWPWTFFLFIWSAIASGPAFTTLIVSLTEKLTGRKLVPYSVKMFYGKVCGWLLLTYMVAKSIDTLYWALSTLPRMGVRFSDLYAQGPYGSWLVWLELGLFGWLPALALVIPKVRQKQGWLLLFMLFDVIGIILNRFAFVIQTQAIPVLPFEKFIGYMFTWPEVGIAAGMLGFGLLVFGLSYRYLPVFPREKELNPVQG
ncbi:MAG: polysulfide reductase NrfD [Deltaproteobacteria bacterium]|nr:polysulfide reductase NrfD [Deltaproteobacteria bacterium]